VNVVQDNDAALPDTLPGGQVSSATRLRGSGEYSLQLTSGLYRLQHVKVTRGLLTPRNPTLRDCLGDRSALVVLSPAVHRLYGRHIERYFGAPGVSPAVEFMVLDRTESSKTLDGVLEVCRRAASAGLRRTSPIVAIGGGVCCDICGLAAALHHRGVPHIKVPTTLVGLVDAGIGIKNAVNYGGRKSAIGSFHPPEYSLLDIDFLASLPRRHLVNGLAEIVKMAIVSDADLFGLLSTDAVALVESGFHQPAAAATQLIWQSVAGMLSELAQNPFENADFRRKVDFGHTFSPYFEVTSGYSILHGEAVAMDIALSAEIAGSRGLLAADDLDRILSLIQDLGLSLAWPRTSIDALWASLAGIMDHRNGDLHLVVPTSIGGCEYLGIEALSLELLRECTFRLHRRGTDRFWTSAHGLSDSVGV
jgi:3-dehydroquinate synthetase